MAPKGSLGLFERQECAIVETALKKYMSLLKKIKKRYHWWAAVGHSFKSDVHFYEIPGNTNGKMSQQVYVYQ